MASQKKTGKIKMSEPARTRVANAIVRGREGEDALNPDFIFSLTNIHLLLAALDGQIDLQQLVREELAGRGYDAEVNWVGFDEARRIFVGK